MFQIILEIAPVAQGRPRFRRIGKGVATYDPPKSKAFKQELRALAMKYQCDYFAKQYQPISVTLSFYSTPPILSKTKLENAFNGILRPFKKPDLDNLIKGTLDGLNGLFWHDDAQIVELHAYKYYAETPRIEMTIEEIN